ncbi:MAG: DUF3326 domain-containing protein [bacterium]
MLRVYEKEIDLNWRLAPPELHQQTLHQLDDSESVIRCVFGQQTSELGVVNQVLEKRTPFAFKQRPQENHNSFNVAYIVPTGVGAAQGGHAGDATPVLKAISSIANLVFTHPNVVNASDINEIPANAMYIEGSLLSSFLMGTIGLARRRQNRVLVLVGPHPEQMYTDLAVNAVNAARSTYGFDCSTIVSVPVTMKVKWSASGRSSGEIKGMDNLFDILRQHQDTYDAIAITSIIDIEPSTRDHYLKDGKDKLESVNPWGGVEAMLTHAISTATNTPSAHGPMMPSSEVDNLDYGVVDARVAAEMISTTYLQCVLKGLQRSPLAVDISAPHALTASDVNAVVIPKGCFGLPIYAALHQNIKVIAVADKIYAADQTDLVRSLSWRPGQYTEVANYKEALGELACLKSGITSASITRPLATIRLTVNVEQQKQPL